MLTPEKYTVRIFWKKTGNSKYISHLDTQRAIVRALIRSGLPIYYSQGYNPHPRLVFALPVSIYQEAYYDIFDIDLTEMLPIKKVQDQLSAAMPVDMPLIRAAYPKKKLKELAFASYSIKLETDSSIEDIENAFKGEVVVEKKTKKKCETADISHLIKDLAVIQDLGGTVLNVTLSAAPEAYLNPKYLVDFLGDKVVFSQTVRTMLFDGDMKPLE